MSKLEEIKGSLASPKPGLLGLSVPLRSTICSFLCLSERLCALRLSHSTWKRALSNPLSWASTASETLAVDSADMLSCIADLPVLPGLKLSESVLERGLNTLFTLSSLTALKACATDPMIARLLERAARSLPLLRHLELELDEEWVPHLQVTSLRLSQLFALPLLDSLLLSDFGVDDSSPRDWEPACSRLKRLKLNLRNENLLYLAQHRAPLTDLSIGSCSDEAAAALASFSQLTALSCSAHDWKRFPRPPASLRRLEVFRMHSLTELGSSMLGRGDWSPLLSPPSLSELSLNSFNLNDNAELSALTRCSSLATLRLEHCVLGLTNTAVIGRCATLRSLQLRRTRVFGAHDGWGAPLGPIDLRDLSQLQLTELVIENVDSLSGACLASFLRMPLRRLRLHSLSSVTDSQLAALTAVTTLKVLDVSSSQGGMACRGGFLHVGLTAAALDVWDKLRLPCPVEAAVDGADAGDEGAADADSCDTVGSLF